MNIKKSTIEHLISTGKTDQALEMLDDLLQNTNSPFIKDVILLKSENEEINRQKRIHTITENEVQLGKNKINSSILELCYEIDKQDTISPNFTSGNKPTRLWIFATIALIAITVASIIYIQYKPVNKDKITQIDYDEKIANLVVVDLMAKAYVDYQKVYVNGSTRSLYDVINSTKTVANSISSIPDTNLQLESQIYKYIGLTISNKILALLSGGMEEKLAYSRQAILYADKAAAFIGNIKDVTDEEYRTEIRNWVDSENHETRILINKFIASAVNYQSKGEIKKEELIILFRRLQGDNVLVNEGYGKYPIVKWLESENIIKINQTQ